MPDNSTMKMRLTVGAYDVDQRKQVNEIDNP